MAVCAGRSTSTVGVPQVGTELRKVFRQRLLHPGANTTQVIDVYISTIKALRLLDPAGVLLESVSEPLKEYLRGQAARPPSARANRLVGIGPFLTRSFQPIAL